MRGWRWLVAGVIAGPWGAAFAEEAVRVSQGAVRFAVESVGAMRARPAAARPAHATTRLSPFPYPGRVEAKATANAEALLARRAADRSPDSSSDAPVATLSAAPLWGFENPATCACEPPDPIIAAGPRELLAGVNGDLRAIDKQSGATLWSATWETFFDPVNPAGPGAFAADPKLFFDPQARRFFALILFIDARITRSWWMVAVSATDAADAESTWHKWALDPTVAAPGAFADFPGFGHSDAAVLISSNMFTKGVVRADLAVIPKAPLLSGAAVVPFTQIREVTTATGSFAFSIQPCLTLSGAGGFLVSAAPLGGASLSIYRVAGPIVAPTLEKLNRPVSSYAMPPDAAQGDSGVAISTGDSRVLSCMTRGSRLWATHHTALAGRAAARWYELNLTGWPDGVAVAQSGTLSATGVDYYFPSISADNFGNALIGASRSAGGAAGEFPSAVVAVRRAGDPPGTLAGVAMVRRGDGAYGGSRFGDYSGTALDPVDGLTFWTMQEFSRGGANWGTWVARVQVGSLCVPPRFGLTADPAAVCGAALEWSPPPIGSASLPLAWSLEGSTPEGLTIDAASGVVRWATPVASAAPYLFAIRVENGCGRDRRMVTLTVRPGDFDADGGVSGADVSGFVTALLGPKFACAADLNGDGRMDGSDIAAFVAALRPDAAG